MKTNKILAALILAAATLPASAQFFNTDTDDYTRLDFQLILSHPEYEDYGVYFSNTHTQYGLGLNYIYGYNLTGHKLPLFVEFGPELNYTYKYEEIDYWDIHDCLETEKIRTRRLTLGTPVDFVYKFRLTDGITVAPYAGIDIKANLLAATYTNGIKADAFSEGANLFQLGWNLGFGFYFNKFYLGHRYSEEITPFIEKHRSKTIFRNNYLNLGIRF